MSESKFSVDVRVADFILRTNSANHYLLLPLANPFGIAAIEHMLNLLPKLNKVGKLHFGGST